MSNISVKSASCPSGYTFKTCRASKYAGKCIKETKKSKPVKKTQKKKKKVVKKKKKTQKKKAVKKKKKVVKKAKKSTKKKAPSLAEMFGIKKKKAAKKTQKKKKVVKKKKAVKKTLKKIKMKCNEVKRRECLLVKKICNPSTGRCKNPEKAKTVRKAKTMKKPKTIKKAKTVKKAKTIKPKTIKKSLTVKSKTIKHKCPADKVKKCESQEKVCNTLTGRCIKRPKPILKKTKKVVKKSKKLKTRIKLVNFKNDALIGNITKQVSKEPTINATKKPTKIPTQKVKTIKSTTPLEIESLGTDIQKSLSKTGKTPSISKLASYSPSVNKQLVTKKSIDRQFIGGCYDSRESTPKVKVGEKCYKSTSGKGQKALLDNLSSKRLIPISKIHAPKQNESNCWFNTMFMCFFISDKGRKFFKFFRELMIKGVQLNGKKVRKSLHDSFLHLDIYIDAVLSGESHQWPQEIDTNNVIKKIYNAMPQKYKNNKMIRPVGEAHNPLKEYEGILNYLGNNTVPFQNINVGYDVQNLLQITKSLKIDSNVEILMVEIYNGKNGPGDSGKGGNEWERKEVLELDDGRKFGLDSAIVRDTQNKHFCCVMTYDKKECGFDGVSFRRLSSFSWKQYLNKNQEWTFEGSNWDDDSGSIKWNFKNGYQILFYYKI